MNPQPDKQSAELMQQRISQAQPLGERICTALQAECRKLGFDGEACPTPAFATMDFQLKQDPFSQEYSLEGAWLGNRQQRIGSLILHADGTFFAEYDVVQQHPKRPQWFVEAVTAWGQGEEIKTEPRLLPMP